MIGIIKKFNKLLDEKQKKKIGYLFVIMLVGAFLEVLGVSLMVPVVTIIMDEDVMSDNEIISRICGMLNITSHRSFVIFCILSLVILYIVKDSFVIFQHYAQARFVCNNRLAMQKKILRSILNRPYEYFLNVKTGEVTQMVISDPSSAFNLLSTLISMITEIIVSAALVVTVSLIEPLMTVFVFAILLITVIIIAKVARPKIKVAGKTFRKCNSSVNSWLIQIVNGIKEIKITKQEKYFEKEYTKVANEGIRAEKLYKTINGVPKSLIEMVSVSGALISILILLLMGRDMADLVPALSAFAVAAIKLLPSANKISTALNEITYSQSYLDKLIVNIDNINALKASAPKESDNISITLDKEIFCKDIVYHYPNTERNVLDGASMLIPAGKSVGIVGVSGAGKTTIVDILLGLLSPQQGNILSDGVDVSDHYQKWLEHIGYIPQTIFILDGTIRDNVAFGVPSAQVDDDRVWKAIEEAQLASYVKDLPDGLDSTVGERGIRISGGQRQRIGIARALYNDPDLLVFDEATSALDNETEASIMEAIESLHGQKTMVIIAHRLQTIKGCDIVYRIEDGQAVRER